MLTTVTKSLSGDFSGNIKQQQFHTELKANAIMSNIEAANFQFINLADDNVDIVFGNVLSGIESNVLSTLVIVHTPDFSKPRVKHYKIFPETRKNKNTSYKTIATFNWPGSQTIGTIDYIDIVARKQNNITSYDIEIIDINNNNVIASKNCTNNNMTCINLGQISNVPQDSTIFEIRARKNGGNNSNKIFIEEVQIYYGN